MSTFQSSKVIATASPDLTRVVHTVALHFEQKGYDVLSVERLGGSWQISIRKGGLFKAVLGMKTALNITIEAVSNGVLVNAGVGIFGQQIVPTAVMWFVFWPVLITQIWGLVKQSQLDDEAIACIEMALASHDHSAGVNADVKPTATRAFCTTCGKSLEGEMRFCPACGANVETT